MEDNHQIRYYRHKTNNTDRTAKHFFVPVNEIVENGYDLSINRYKEIVYEEVEYKKPNTILITLKNIENEIVKDLRELENLLND